MFLPSWNERIRCRTCMSVCVFHFRNHQADTHWILRVYNKNRLAILILFRIRFHVNTDCTWNSNRTLSTLSKIDRASQNNNWELPLPFPPYDEHLTNILVTRLGSIPKGDRETYVGHRIRTGSRACIIRCANCFSCGKNGRGMMLTTNLHEVPKVKMMLYTPSILRLS